MVLLFHQGGGDVRGEYGPLIPWLLESGFDVVAVDQRLGGDRFGGTNRTAARVAEKQYSYCDAYHDVEAALDFSRKTFGVKPIVWGSSYSAALVIKLAASRPNDVAGVLAFSPAGGEPMQGCDVSAYAADVKAPLLVLRQRREMEIPWIQAQNELLKTTGISVYVPPNGTHGSSMLVPERVEGPVDEARQTVLRFLESVR
ncbi:MAG TPA: alpha/beta fold hydrolase [Thermoanaerobaculia bacterium]|nr:alpha/beta fold hydrolase [Thermoanaerobaculia bacterium]